MGWRWIEIGYGGYKGIDGVEVTFLCIFVGVFVIRSCPFVCRDPFCTVCHGIIAECMEGRHSFVGFCSVFVCCGIITECMEGAPFVLCWAAKEDWEFDCVLLLLVVL